MNFQYRTTVTSQNTEALIREAAYRLSTTQLLATDFDMESKRTPEIISFLNEKMGNKAPDELARAFAAIHFILVKGHACNYYIGNHDENWPYLFTYKGTIEAYEWHKKILEVSVLTEKSPNRNRYYMCFNFPERDHTYHIEEIETIPTFMKKKEEMNAIAIGKLFTSISLVIDSFCCKFFERGKIPSKECSLRGIEPIFHDEGSGSGEQPPKKRKKNTRELLPYDTTKFKPSVFPDFYERLCKLFKSIEPKPNPSSRLLATIYEILVEYYGCKALFEENEWPGGNDCNAIQIWFPHFLNSEEVEYSIFSLSLMSNGREFFCCFRSEFDDTKKIIQKLNSSLVPEFDSNKDLQRIDNLCIWVSAVNQKFIQKVIVGPFSSLNISFVSRTSVSADEDEPS